MKRLMGVDGAVSWAFRDMRIEEEQASIGERDFEPSRWGSTWGTVAEIVSLGCIVDRSMNLGVRAPVDEQARVRDALAIAAEVAGMDVTLGLYDPVTKSDKRIDWAVWGPDVLGEVGRLSAREVATMPYVSVSRLIRTQAYAGVAPTWRPEGFGFEPINGKRHDPIVFRNVDWLQVGARRVRFETAWCPVRARDRLEIIGDRVRYLLWWWGLAAIIEALQGKLETLDLVAPVVPERPWQMEREDGG